MPQKRSLRQMERQQQQRGEKEGGKQGKARVEKTIGSLDIPDLKSEDLLEQLGQMRAITPTAIASQFNIKVSMAKRLLEELRRNEVVDLASRSHNLKVYQLRTAGS
ncbi:hypothetical protein AC482_02695 [miscellaneous Crenarchaeota group-15 archaeon DG-45]|uniref:30S ribosomal protein S25e n=1 Tax=miscellaneous Crenarchaeota group-15 archaeon DG-45 TaxID=1685127 RepID=A0A0M0BRK5_9ARCH|nr:MAG: hypothetical protein AC482_02695 [miscellaneous Crenarchaeota group-15 archaeon DG-45]